MKIEWFDYQQQNWEQDVARQGGHPLQTALWGDARSQVDGISQLQLIGRTTDGTVVGLARVEVRKIRFVGNVAWIPRGPAITDGQSHELVNRSLTNALKARGFLAAIDQPWHEVVDDNAQDDCPQTIWIDLSIGKDRLFENLDSQWRYGVRRAGREGVTVEQSLEPKDVSDFFRLCSHVSETKGFTLPGSERLIQELLDRSKSGQDVEARLFVARHEQRLGAGAVVMRCGRNAHYLWGAVDRELSKYRTGEAVQWAVMEWAVDQGCIQYDLEGIDPATNPGTYKFKKKMGGRIVRLPRNRTTALGLRGACIKAIISRR